MENRVNRQTVVDKDSQGQAEPPATLPYSGSEDKHRLEEYKQAMFMIRQATGVSDINDVI